MDNETMAKLRSMLLEYHRAASEDKQAPAGIPVRMFIADDIVSQVGDMLVREYAVMRSIVEAVAAMPTEGIDPTAPYHVTVTKARRALSEPVAGR